MTWFFILYCILSIGFVTYGTNKLYPLGMLRSIIYAIGSVLLFIFFGFRWFASVAASKSWPPTINMCPDYLTFVPKISGATSVSRGVCVDLLGVTSRASGLAKSNLSELTTIRPTDTNKVFQFTAADITAANGNATAIQTICNRCQVTGVTWEGVYDGDVCQGLNRASMAQGSQCR